MSRQNYEIPGSTKKRLVYSIEINENKNIIFIETI